MDKLKPCPFCGGDVNAGHDDCRTNVWIECDNERCGCCYYGEPDELWENVLPKWNNRAEGKDNE